MILLSFVIAHRWSADIYWSTEGFDIVFLLNLFLISIYYWCYRVYGLIHTVAVHQISVLSIISFSLVTALTNLVYMVLLYYSPGMAFQTALIGSFRDEWINYKQWEETKYSLAWGRMELRTGIEKAINSNWGH